MLNLIITTPRSASRVVQVHGLFYVLSLIESLQVEHRLYRPILFIQLYYSWGWVSVASRPWVNFGCLVHKIYKDFGREPKFLLKPKAYKNEKCPGHKNAYNSYPAPRVL